MIKRRIFTLAIVREGERVLLGKKKRKHGKGFWNGFGGGVEDGETIEAAAVREVKEEVKITPTNIVKRGVLEFYYADKPLGADVHEVHVFEVREFTGEPVETEEMDPRWFAIDKIPYDNMWKDDQHWLPLLLAGKSFSGFFEFNDEQEIVRYNVEEWHSIPQTLML